MLFMNAANPNIRYGSTSPGEGWVYAGKTRNPTSPPKAGWQTIDYWKKAPAPAPAPAPAAAPKQEEAPPAAATPEPPKVSAETTKYRDEAKGYMDQAQSILDSFKIEQQRAAEAARLAEEMRIKSQATVAANMARSQQTPNLQIQPASGTPDTAGTQGFKRRKGSLVGSAAQALASLNIGSSNLMNV
jgi:hypothetical protein